MIVFRMASKLIGGVVKSVQNATKSEDDDDDDDSSLPVTTDSDYAIPMSSRNYESPPPVQVVYRGERPPHPTKPMTGPKILCLLKSETAKDIKLGTILINLHSQITSVLGIKSPFKICTLTELGKLNLSEVDYSIVEIETSNAQEYKDLHNKGALCYIICTTEDEDRKYRKQYGEMNGGQIILDMRPTCLYYSALIILQNLESIGWYKVNV